MTFAYNGSAVSGATAVFLFLTFGLIVDVRLVRGLPFPPGYEGWMFLLGSALGVSTAAMIGKRLSDINYKTAAPPPVNTTVEAPSTNSQEG